MGMTADEYWNGDAELPRYYREAYKLRQQHENYNAWLQGFYVYHAMQCVSPMFRDWMKDHSPEKYMSEPLELFPKKAEEVSEQKKADDKELANQEIIKAWVRRVNQKKNEKKEGVTNG